MAPRASGVGLTGLTYQILLALSGGARHGYAILKEIEEREGPDAVPSTGALYVALQRLQGDGLLEAVPAPDLEADQRRRYYDITEAGRARAVEETRRLAALVRTARERDLLPAPERG